MNQKTAKNLLYSIGLLILTYFLFQYVLPMILPFVLALVLALLLSKPMGYISSKLHVKKSLLSSIATALILLLSGGILWFFVRQFIRQLQRLIASGTLSAFYPKLLRSCSQSLSHLLKFDSEKMYTSLCCTSEHITQYLKTDFLSCAFSGSISSMVWMGEMLTFLVITITATLFFFKDLEPFRRNMRKLPFFPFLSHYYHTTLTLTAIYLRAQLIILALTILFTTIGLFLVKQPYAFVLGTAIGLLDALPFFGSGFVLLPMAIWELLTGHFLPCAILLTVYIINSAVRDVLEPKLIGNRLRVPSIYILMSIYIGFCLFHAKGILFGPLYLLFNYQLLKWFWKQSE